MCSNYDLEMDINKKNHWYGLLDTFIVTCLWLLTCLHSKRTITIIKSVERISFKTYKILLIKSLIFLNVAPFK